MAKWGSIVHLDDNIGEDVYKSRVCILTSYLDIISEVIKVRVDGEVFPIRIKEAPGWNASFTWDFINNHQGGIEAFDRFEQEGSNDSIVGNEEASQDTFGIYDPLEKLDNEENLHKKSANLPKLSSQGQFQKFPSAIEKDVMPSSSPVIGSVPAPVLPF